VFLGILSVCIGWFLFIFGYYDLGRLRLLENQNKLISNPIIWFFIALICVFPILILSSDQKCRNDRNGVMNKKLKLPFTSGKYSTWIILGIALGFSIFLGAREGISIAFAFMSMVVAAYSISIATNSLKLTRITTRPFLNVRDCNVIWTKEDETSATVKYFIIHIENIGVFPADQISILFEVGKPEDETSSHLFVANEAIQTICFPNEEISNIQFNQNDEEEKLTVKIDGSLHVQIMIEYINKATKEKHKTKRKFLVIYKPDINPKPVSLPNYEDWD